MGTGSRPCWLGAQACVLSDKAEPGKLGGSGLIQHTEEKGKEAGLKTGFFSCGKRHIHGLSD